MAYNTAITFPPKSHTHSEYSPTNHTHTGYAATSHTHNVITSRGLMTPQTGRTQSLGNVYTYELFNQSSPCAYGSVLGFGAFGISGGGQIELASSWAGTGTPTVYVRALRDTTDNWTNWKTLISSSGGNVEGQITRSNNGTSWIKGRDGAMIRGTVGGTGSFYVMTSSKTPTGSWDVGVLNENYYFSYAKDTNYNANTNSTTLFYIEPSGNTNLRPITYLQTIYPVGSIYISTNATNPNTLFGFGTWGLVAQNRMLLGCDSGKATTTGGSMTKSVPLLAHTHYYTPSVSVSSELTDGHHSHSVQVIRDAKAKSGTDVKIPVNGFSGVDTTMFLETKDALSNPQYDGSHSHKLVCSRTATESTGTANVTMDVTNAYYAVYVWRRTA